MRMQYTYTGYIKNTPDFWTRKGPKTLRQLLLLGIGMELLLPFSKKMPNTQRKVTKSHIHIRDIIPDRSTVLDFF